MTRKRINRRFPHRKSEGRRQIALSPSPRRPKLLPAKEVGFIFGTLLLGTLCFAGCGEPEPSKEDFGKIVTQLPDLQEAQGEYVYPDIGVDSDYELWRSMERL